MHSLLTIIVVVQVLSALVIIGLVLVQHGKGADMGAAFGSGASGSLFGATGSSNFLSKSTGIAAVVFFTATLGLAYFGSGRSVASHSVTDSLTSASSAPKSAVLAPSSAPAKSTPATVPPAAAGQSNQIPK